MNEHKALSLLSLAKKAGKVVSGEYSTEKTVKSGKAFLVVIAQDASANTRKKFADMSTFHEVPLVYIASKERLGRTIGKEYRASLAVLDENFSEAILRTLNKESQ